MTDKRTDSLEQLIVLMDQLRLECPWDAKQTHTSLRSHLLEETYEVLEALDAMDEETGEGSEHLQEELGDLLLHIVFHARIAEDLEQFTLEDVATQITEKLIHRHPHVFPPEGEDSEEPVDVERMVSTWEQIKKKEKNRSSVFDGIPATLPSLARASKVVRKSSILGFNPSLPDLHLETEEDLGEILLGLVEWARQHDVDPEGALRVTVEQYVAKMRVLEQENNSEF
ncbi:MAG: MazG family protein [Acidimicrobiales bacterium]|nr:MazG family protein [Acidimicrobiales bacterium]